MRDRSITHSLQRWVSTKSSKIFDLTARVCFFFSSIVEDTCYKVSMCVVCMSTVFLEYMVTNGDVIELYSD